MIARRPLLTAGLAGALLIALWFVPSAKATATPGSPGGTARHSAGFAAETPYEKTHETAHEGHLADTGSIDTTPYVAGGTAFLGLGAGFVLYSVRRERAEAC
ncbi:LPXTG cell wall anchor domain-containing protein [Streptomyces aureocirculatus]|uniref:LPXTG cell wall anchor domain-containing protein n=1 Tax=Streptomyces aureocirculatus TaxID=67275 RepID=UPI000A75F3DB|nr:LPXTG cell wall anchor domain-containing protein [Streptomyces aureocirculatus]